MATTRLIVERAHSLGGLTLTATTALSRADVRAIFDTMERPGYDKAHVLIMNKVLNEADVMPVDLTQLAAQVAKLLRKRGKRLLVTKAGQALAQERQAEELFRRLFATVFWKLTSATSIARRSKHSPKITLVSCSGPCRLHARSGSGRRI